MKRIKIDNHWIGERCPVFIIAEAGINHNGDYRKALELVDAAAECGADAVKFQTHLPEHEMLREGFSAGYIGQSFFDLLKKCQLSEIDHLRLMQRAKKKKIMFLSTPFSREAVDFLDRIGIAAFKTGSGELTNIPLLEHIAKKNKPMIISTGMSSMTEIGNTVKAITKLNKEIILMQCTSTYPAEYKNINLAVIKILKKRFGFPVGLSDHSYGMYTALGAVALGAAMIEKHFTLNRSWPGPDQKASITPRELQELVRGTKALQQALGNKKNILREEIPVRKMANESVVSLRDINAGERLTLSNVWVKRPGTGIPAASLKNVIGRSARKQIRINSLIKWSDLQ
ncbi:MAG: hypothetical protein A2Y00_03060 [Omnitrophica WOR_2 bacterium GWF2_43_52]|nr:MAG: hypothetical protein A2Y00_03060 [Omnitrophica WOR_2 bacterium GWF2_43_52]OGX55400.1 MAG: hypothetical protein A2460_07510 [Omnitrophica WOR_2 bacterium RIFOXYC2_FULL_43_9]HAH20832.1 hypothetical protein [Candidatus Omnitrophota bacterium]HBG64500.1 hypothetical protein [Candidatus Omnitrophota bacterium]HCD38478.1 hypothetical protein [Candidatus Omnitrophota bacterium]